jgi:hypothetical protein
MTRNATPEEVADHDHDLRKHDNGSPRRDPLTHDQKYALAKLIGAMEGIISSGVLAESGIEPELREIVARALAAFDLPSKTEASAILGFVQ